jgi:oxygen-independent coproporphyrinogen-3 oxidase
VSSHDIEKKEERFIQAILKEWDLKKHLIPKDRVLTLYFGGGTPTELSAKSLSFLIETFKTAYPTIQEITVEGNPESITLEKIKKIKEVGCNRYVMKNS